MTYSVKTFPCNFCQDKGKKRIPGSRELTYCHCLAGMRLKLSVYRQAVEIQPGNIKLLNAISWITKAIQTRLTYKLTFYLTALAVKYKIRRIK